MTRRMTGAAWGFGVVVALLAAAAPAAAQESWVERAVHNFGEPINTLWAEGELTFAGDGTMVYCSAREDLGAAPGDPKDLYIATFDAETGRWNTPVNMGQPVNSAPATDVDPLRLGDDREPWITADGNTIYFKSDRLATSEPRNASDLFVTRKVEGEWTTPELLPYPISTDAGNEHCPAIMADGETLCFASRREGGYGGSDIWCSRQDADGEWQEPVNRAHHTGRGVPLLAGRERPGLLHLGPPRRPGRHGHLVGDADGAEQLGAGGEPGAPGEHRGRRHVPGPAAGRHHLHLVLEP